MATRFPLAMACAASGYAPEAFRQLSKRGYLDMGEDTPRRGYVREQIVAAALIRAAAEMGVPQSAAGRFFNSTCNSQFWRNTNATQPSIVFLYWTSDGRVALRGEYEKAQIDERIDEWRRNRGMDRIALLNLTVIINRVVEQLLSLFEDDANGID